MTTADNRRNTLAPSNFRNQYYGGSQSQGAGAMPNGNHHLSSSHHPSAPVSRYSLAPNMLHPSSVQSAAPAPAGSKLSMAPNPYIITTPQHSATNMAPGGTSSNSRLSMAPSRSLKTPTVTTLSLQSNLMSQTHSQNFHNAYTKEPQLTSNSMTLMTKEVAGLSLQNTNTSYTGTAAASRSSMALKGSTLSRASTAASQTDMGARTSMGLRRSLGKHSLSSSLSNAFGSTLQTMMKDPRPIREKSFQYSAIRNLIKFLAEHEYDRPISPKILASPSAKDFQLIFKFLYACLDPGYNWNDKKFEDEVPSLMKGLRYPFANDISKSHLLAVGSIHAWPSLLAMLHWIVELINCCEVLSAEAPLDTEFVESSQFLIPSDESETGSDKMFFDYLSKSYKMFLSGDDNYGTMEAELTENFGRKNEVMEKEVNIIKSELDLILKEIEVFESAPSPLIELEKQKASLLYDIEKYKKFIKHQEGKKAKYLDTIESGQTELVSIQNESKKYQELKTSLQATVEAQSVYPEDIERMKLEKETLTKSLESLAKTKEEAIKALRAKDLYNREKIEQLETITKEYNSLAERLSLIPSTAKHAHGKSYELKFSPFTNNNFATEDENKENITFENRLRSAKNETGKISLFNLDLKASVIPVVTSLRDSVLASTRELSEQLALLKESSDALSESISDKLDEITLTEERIKKLTNEYAIEKEKYTAENKKSSEEIEIIENQLKNMKNDMTTSYLSSQQEIQRLTIEYDQTKRKADEEKERIARDIFNILGDVVAMKKEIENGLGDLERWIDSEDSLEPNGSS